MKILYVVARPIEINTSSSLRNLATINGFLKLGHEVTLLETRPDEKHPNFDLTLSMDNVNQIFVEEDNRQKFNKFGRNLNFMKPIRRFVYSFKMSNNIYGDFSNFSNKYKQIELNLDDYDIIISSSDPKSSHLFVYNLLSKKKNLNKNWVQIWGDPFGSDITRSKKEKKVYEEEEKLLSEATKIIYVSPLTLDEQKRLFPKQSEKMFFVPTPYLRKDSNYSFIQNYNEVNFLYAGDYNSSVRNILPIINAFNKSEINHKLTIAGSGDVAIKKTKNVNCLGRLSYSEIKKLESETDVLVFLANKKGSQIPGKIYQYSGSTKPILFLTDGDMAQEIEDYFKKKDRYIFLKNESTSILDFLINLNNLDDLKFTYRPVDDFNDENVAMKILSL